jgi:hypothetical protein
MNWSLIMSSAILMHHTSITNIIMTRQTIGTTKHFSLQTVEDSSTNSLAYQKPLTHKQYCGITLYALYSHKIHIYIYISF